MFALVHPGSTDGPIFGIRWHGVETQVSMGAYRPYCKTLYWTCWSMVTFAIFALSHISRILHFRFLAFSCISHIAHISRSHTVHILHTCISHRFRISAFFALWHALPHTSLGSIAFRLHVLSSSSKVHWCVFHFVSLALYHICLCIPIYVHLSRYVFILHHPCTFSATYSALRPGNSLSMLTRQHIVGGFYFTSLPSLRQLVRRT